MAYIPFLPKPQETLFASFQNLPWLHFHWHLPSRIWKDHPATPLLGLQAKCLLQLHPSLILFPRSLVFILATLFRPTSGLLAAKAMASPLLNAPPWLP